MERRFLSIMTFIQKLIITVRIWKQSKSPIIARANAYSAFNLCMAWYEVPAMNYPIRTQE